MEGDRSYTTLSVKKRTARRLKSRRRSSRESFDEIIVRLLDATEPAGRSQAGPNDPPVPVGPSLALIPA